MCDCTLLTWHMFIAALSFLFNLQVNDFNSQTCIKSSDSSLILHVSGHLSKEEGIMGKCYEETLEVKKHILVSGEKCDNAIYNVLRNTIHINQDLYEFHKDPVFAYNTCFSVVDSSQYIY